MMAWPKRIALLGALLLLSGLPLARGLLVLAVLQLACVVSGKTVRSLAYFGGELYVGGNFTTMGGLEANYLVRWAPSKGFRRVGGQIYGVQGSDTYVATMTVSGKRWLLVAGHLDTFDNDRILGAGAVWDGEKWHALGASPPRVPLSSSTHQADVFYLGMEVRQCIRHRVDVQHDVEQGRPS